MVDDLLDRFNHAEQSRQDLTPQGQALLYDRVAEEGIQLTNIQSAAEFRKVSEIYGDLMQDQSYVQDEVRVAERQGLIDIVTTQMGQIEGLIARLEDAENPQAAMTAVEAVGQQYAEIIKLVNQYEPTPYR